MPAACSAYAPDDAVRLYGGTLSKKIDSLRNPSVGFTFLCVNGVNS